MKLKKLIYSLIAIAIFLSIPTAECWAITEAYMKVKIDGSYIQGSSDNPAYLGSDGWSAISSFGSSAYIPTDSQTGQQTGGKTHDPLRIVKPVDRMTPLLFQAMAMGQNVDEVLIEVLDPDPLTGQPVLFFSIFVEVGKVIAVSTSLLPSDQGNQIMEMVTFGYQTITWKEEINAIGYTDSWQQP